MSFETDKRIAFLTVGRGGWTGHHRAVAGSSISRSTTSHYGDSWQEHDYTPDAVAVDTTAIADEQIVTFALIGPLVDVNLSPGMVSHALGAIEPFDPRPSFERPANAAPFGNAGSLDNVAPDVFVRLARSFGARVFDPAAVIRQDRETDAFVGPGASTHHGSTDRE